MLNGRINFQHKKPKVDLMVHVPFNLNISRKMKPFIQETMPSYLLEASISGNTGLLELESMIKARGFKIF